MNTNQNMNGTVNGTMTGVTVLEGGRKLHIAVPYYCNNAFGIEATVSQICMYEKYDLQLMTLPTATNSPDSRAEDWYNRMVNGDEKRPALIKMVDPNTREKVAVFSANIIEAEPRNYILSLTQIIDWRDK